MHRDASGNNRVQCKRYLFLEKAARQQERKYKSKESEQRTSTMCMSLKGVGQRACKYMYTVVAQVWKGYVMEEFRSFLCKTNLLEVVWDAHTWQSVRKCRGRAVKSTKLKLCYFCSAECGFEAWLWHFCHWARHLTSIASLHPPRGKWVPVRTEMVHVIDLAE